MNSLIAEYRKLTVGPETLHALDATLALLEKATGLQIRARRSAVMVTKAPAWTPYARSWKTLSDIIARAAPSQPTMLRPRRGPLSLRVRCVRTQWCLATLPRHLSADRLPESQYSFVIDRLLLLFHQAYFVLLPKIERVGWTAERNDLISTFLAFADLVPSIAERFRIVALAYEARADTANAVASFEKALSAAHVDEHVFMTRLQTFWMALLDKGDFTAALHLLLKVMPTVPLKNLSELRELILATFEEYGEACTGGRVAG